jgi:hypothetical protein
MSAASQIFSYPHVGRPISPSNEIARPLISIMAQRAGSRTAYTQAQRDYFQECVAKRSQKLA